MGMGICYVKNDRSANLSAMLENCTGKIDERIAHNILKTTLSNFTGDSSAWTNIGWGPSRKNVKDVAYLSKF